MVRRVSGFVARKMGGAVLGEVLPRNSTEPLPPPDDLRATIEFQKRKKDQIPLKSLDRGAATEVTTEEQEQFEQELSNDGEFLDAAEKAARWLQDRREGAVDPNFAARAAESETTETMIDSDLLIEPVLDGSGPGIRSRGFFSALKLIKAVAVVGVKVVSRFVKKRDHGAYATIIEEILRECYLTEFGIKVWGTMKRQAVESFKQAATPRGGRHFMDLFARLTLTPTAPKLSIVGHSAGAIYACHLAQYVASEKGKSLPANFKFSDVIFLAPACGFSLLNNTWTSDPDLFSNFRMFALSDEIESGYWEVKVIYPRSLLYLVSGALELEENGSGAFDLPIVGMQRYFTATDVYDMPEVKNVRQLLNGKTYWSVFDGGNGLQVNSQKHGQFFLDEDRNVAQVLKSAIYSLKQGL